MGRKPEFTLYLLAGALMAASGQAFTLQVTDTVQIPFVRQESPTDLAELCFDEIWSVYPSRPALYKEVTGYRVLDYGEESRDWPGDQYHGIITYEYALRDPQTGKEDVAFAPVSELVKKHSALARSYDLGTQLISVKFSEDWYYDTLKHELTKKVESITPVIWQRRQTSEGEPVNDGETGLPVYYKLELESILLRNP
jgi:hypothetical protein